MNHDEFFDGYDGGGELPAEAVRSDLTAPQWIARTYLDKQLIRLLTLNPDLQIQFRNSNLASMDDSMKRQLLEDMRDILNIHTPDYEESFR